MLAGDELRATAADIEDQQPAIRMRPARFDAEVNEAGFLAAGDDLDRSADGERGALDEFDLIARVADGAGGYCAHSHHVQLLILLRHARQHGAAQLHGIRRDDAVAEHALAQPRDHALGG